jgi:hypothetical protein
MPRDGRFPFFKAACYVQDAFDGVERVHPIELRPSVRWAQLLHLRAAPLFPYTRLAYVLLTLFEVPWWASGRTVPDDQLKLEHFPTSGLPFVPYQYSNFFEALCLALLVLELAMQYQYQGAQQLVWARWPCVTAVLLVTGVVEAIITVQTQSIFAPFIRMGLIIAANDHGAVSLRRQLQLIYNIVQRFVPLAALSGVFLGAFAWAGMISFAGTNQAKAVQPDGTPFMWAFDSFSSAAWSLYVTFTSSNTPDVMMPAYNNNRFAAAYFLIFILSGVFFVSNFMLAIVYSEFKSEHTRVKQRIAGTKARHLKCAFRLISRPPRSDEGDHQRDRSGELHRVADQASLLCVFEELNLYSGIKYISNEKAAILFAMLDQSGDGLVYQRDFGRLIDMLHMDFVKKQRQPWLLACANRSKSCCAHHLHRMQRAVNCHAFDVAVDALIVLNLSVLLFLTHRVYLHADATPLDVQGMPGWVPVFRTVTALFSLEIGLRATFNSWHDFWGQNYLNRYDSCVVLGMLACVTLLSYDDDHNSITRISILLQSARSWRPLLRIKPVRRASCVDGEPTPPRATRTPPRRARTNPPHAPSRQFANIFHTFTRTLPAAFVTSRLLFVVIYLFSALGLALFGGDVTTDPTSANFAKLAATDFGSAGATMGDWACSFNDLLSGMVTLFFALLVNNWFVFSDGYSAVSSPYAYCFFVVYYAFSVIICFNIVTSIVLDVFLTEYETRDENNQVVVRGEATVQANHASFNAREITGTTTGLDGDYEVTMATDAVSMMDAMDSAGRTDALVHAFSREGGDVSLASRRLASAVSAAAAPGET